MAICEYCARAHRARFPNTHFCSVLCRGLYDEYVVEYFRERAKPQLYRNAAAVDLAELVVKTSERARHVLTETAGRDSEEQIGPLRELLMDLAQGNTRAQDIYSYLSLFPEHDAPPPGPEAGA